MSNKAITWALDIPVRGNRKLVLFVLADYANEENDECWPGLDRLSQICGISRSNLIHHIKELTKSGWMSKKSRYDDEGNRTSNLYRLNLELSPESLRSENTSLSPDLPPIKSRICTLTLRNPKEPKDICKVDTPSVKNIFEHWQKIMNHPLSKLDGKRKATINKSIKLGYTEDDLKMAIEGCAKNPFNMGENDNNTKYDDIELILRDAKHIERFMNNYKNPPKPKSVKKEPWEGGRYDSRL